jgi:phospholipid/cholesterol/gamma-HCH transport system substrate-binding protein
MIKLFALGTALATVAAAVLGVAGNQGPYTITGHFLSAEGVVPGNDVLIDGVKVGTVASVSLAPDDDPTGGALVQMNLDRKYAPLHAGTKAQIRQKGFLGNMYVELTPGPDGNKTMRSGATIPLQDTAAPVDLDQVMDIFDANTRQKIQTMTRQGGVMLAGEGQNLNDILAQLPGLTADVASVTGNVDQSDQQLDELTVEFDQIAYEMASEDESLRGDLHNGASLLDTIAQHETQLQGEITYANQGLGNVNAGLSGHEKDLATLLQMMPALEGRLKTFSANADPALADINMCYPDVIQAIAGLRSSDDYKHPQGAQDANGYMLRVYTTIAPPGTDPYPGSAQPAQLSCSGGTPTP